MDECKEKNVLITGTARGLGKAFVEEFAKNGANVIAHARKETPEFMRMIADVSQKYGVSVTPVFFDMTDYPAMKKAVQKLYADKIFPDILVNNAGLAHGGLFQMTSMAKIREVFEVNLFSQMELTQLVLKSMTRKRSGSIINVSSVSAFDLKPGNSAYGVSKASLKAWTTTLAAECAPYGIRVNAVAPGVVDTEMFNQMEKKAKSDVINSSSMGRLGTPLEVAKAILFLASDQASFVTGQTLRVDGGIV